MLDCLPDMKIQSRQPGREHNDIKQGRSRSLPAVASPKEMMELELGEFTCTQIKEAISSMKVSLKRKKIFFELQNV